MHRLNLRYCDFGGSSRGARDWIRTRLAAFAQAHPHVECRTIVGRGKHPVVQGEYLKGIPRGVDLRNKTGDQVEEFVMSLRNTNGHKVGKFAKPVYSKTPSVQGMWTLVHQDAKNVQMKIETR